MLSERYVELLTAYVDGELSNRQRRTLLRLLRKSVDARELLRKLQGDSREINLLPRRKLDNGFSLQVLNAIGERGQRTIARPAAALRPSRLAAWAGWAAAAMVLVAVGAASYRAYPLLFNSERARPSLASNEVVAPRQKSGSERASSGTVRGAPDPIAVVKGTQENRLVRPLIPDDKTDKNKKNTAQVVQKDIAKPPVKNIERQPEEEYVLGSWADPDLPRIGGPNLSVTMPLEDVEKKAAREKLLAKLKKDSAFHVQILCRDTARGFERLQSVLKANKIQLVIEQPVLARLKNPKLRTTFVLYAENLQPDELVTIFEQLRRADRQQAKPKAPEEFGYVLVNTMSSKFLQRLSKFLGVAAARPAIGKSKAPAGVDIRKPVGEGTAAAIERTLKEREIARSQVKPDAGQSGLRQVLVLAYNDDKTPVNGRSAHSKEVKRFRDGRQERLPGTLQVVLVLLRDNV